jgi:hypothetical protein
MRGVQVPVPKQAQDRLSELTMLRDSALEASHSAQRRLNMTDGDSQMAQKLAGEKARQAAAHNELARLLSNCNQYLFQLRLPIGYCLEPAAVPVTLKKGETAADAIGVVRAEIAEINRHMPQVRSVPLKKQSQQDAIHSYLARLAMGARPKIGFDQQGNAKLAWREDFATMNDVVGLLALICPAELVSAFQLDVGPDPPNAISPDDREHKLSGLSAKLLELERREAALLAQADGILPRPEMNPQAYLQVRVAQQEQEEEAQAVA